MGLPELEIPTFRRRQISSIVAPSGKSRVSSEAPRPLAQRREKANGEPAHCGFVSQVRWAEFRAESAFFHRQFASCSRSWERRDETAPRERPAIARLHESGRPNFVIRQAAEQLAKNPAVSLSSSWRTTSAVQSRGATPVPPVMIIASRVGSSSRMASEMRSASSGTMR